MAVFQQKTMPRAPNMQHACVLRTKKPSWPALRVTVTVSSPSPVLSTVDVRWPVAVSLLQGSDMCTKKRNISTGHEICELMIALHR